MKKQIGTPVSVGSAGEELVVYRFDGQGEVEIRVSGPAVLASIELSREEARELVARLEEAGI